MLAEALRLIRVYHDLKQQELADRIDLSKSYLSELESGKKVPSFDVIQKYSDEFGIPPSSILFFAENIGNPTKASRTRSAIAGKVLQFLQFIEANTADGKA
ncbi:MAG: helix-turn-helix transcriptional regulator [Roseobacter sp.]|uniref:helix-turn-helix domain-containing protein n=1 Tax=Alphaproteobacteria TaxID=28211 RepID=UPI003264427E